MASVATNVIARSAELQAPALCSQIAQGLQNLLLPFARQSRSDDDFDAFWDFGGCAAFLVGGPNGLSVLRVGNLRIVAVSESSTFVVMHEHALLVAQPNGQHAAVTTACLAAPELPDDIVMTLESVPECLLVGPPAVLERLPAAMITEALRVRDGLEAKRLLLRVVDDYALETNEPLQTASLLLVRAKRDGE